MPWKINGQSMVLYKWIFNYNFKWCKKFFNKGQAVQSTSCTMLNPMLHVMLLHLAPLLLRQSTNFNLQSSIVEWQITRKITFVGLYKQCVILNVTVPNWVGEPVWIHRGRVYSLFNGISVTVGISSRDVNQHLNQTIIKENIQRDVRWKN